MIKVDCEGGVTSMELATYAKITVIACLWWQLALPYNVSLQELGQNDECDKYRGPHLVQFWVPGEIFSMQNTVKVLNEECSQKSKLDFTSSLELKCTMNFDNNP